MSDDLFDEALEAFNCTAEKEFRVYRIQRLGTCIQKIRLLYTVTRMAGGTDLF